METWASALSVPTLSGVLCVSSVCFTFLNSSSPICEQEMIPSMYKFTVKIK